MRKRSACCWTLCVVLGAWGTGARADASPLQQAAQAEARGDANTAITYYSQALSDPNLSAQDQRAAYIGRGQARGSSGDFTGAISDYEAAIRLNPRQSDAYYLRALTRSDIGDYQGALEDLNYVASAAYVYPQYYYYRGYIEYEMHSYDAAIADFSTAAQSQPREAAVFYHRGRAYAEKGDSAAAMSDFGTTIHLKPTDSSTLYAAYRWHGTEAFALHEYPQASTDFSELLKLTPTDGDAAMRLAYVDYADGNYAAAAGDASRVIHTDSPIERGTVFPWPGVINPTACLYDRIVEQYNQGILAKGIDPYALVLRARSELKLGQKRAALADYAFAVRAIPPGADDSVAAEMAAARR